MKQPLFITGNTNKAAYLTRYLGVALEHQKLDLEEIQSLDLAEVVTHKAKQAYDMVKKPVLVEDVSLEFHALGRLPGTFIKFFVDEVPFESICKMLDGLDRAACARCTFAYYDGKEMTLFESSLDGTISDVPRGNNGYGWDKIFVPEGYSLTRAELSEEDDQKTYELIKPLRQVRDFLQA
jgi:inosine triphosphate pyrophosphatase